jgi:putative ABC transport system permease protein
MGNLKLSFFLAFKSILKGNRWTLLLIIAVMSLSFTNLLVMPSILAGVTNTLNRQQIDTVLSNIIVSPPQNKYYVEKASSLIKKIDDVPGVVGAAPHLNNSALIEYNWKDKKTPTDKGIGGTWQVIGIEPSQEKQVTVISRHMIQGSYLDDSDTDKIVLGVEIAGGSAAQTVEFLTLGGAKVGDKVRLTYPNSVQREYTVKGIFQAKEIMQADRLAFVTTDEMESVLGRNIYFDRASQILVKIGNENESAAIISQIKPQAGNAEVRSWSDYGAISGIISSFNVVTSLIGTIGLIVAGIVMFIVIYINVIHKKKQIGILRAIGIKSSVIEGAYIMQSLFYAATGIIIGGLLFGYVLQPFFRLHPIDLPIGQLSLAISAFPVNNAVLGILAAAVFAGLVPVVSITRQSIIQAIWGD